LEIRNTQGPKVQREIFHGKSVLNMLGKNVAIWNCTSSSQKGGLCLRHKLFQFAANTALWEKDEQVCRYVPSCCMDIRVSNNMKQEYCG